MENKNNLGEASIFKLMLRYSLPCILSLLISAIYNTVDQIFIGNSSLSTLGNAATGVVFPVLILSQGFAWCIGNGTSTNLNICQGKNDQQHAHKSVGTAISATLIISVILMIILFPLQKEVLMLFGASDQNIDYAMEYLNWILIFLPTFMFTNMLSTVISADGSPLISMLTMLSGAIVNIILDPIFIFSLDMGMTGAALATGIGQVASTIITIIYFCHTKTFKLHLNSFKIDFHELFISFKLGFSTLITQITLLIVTVTTNSLLRKYGMEAIYGADIPVAIFGITGKVYAILINLVVGIVLGCQPIISYNMGAKNYHRLKLIYQYMLYLAIGVSLVFTLIFQLAPDFVIKLFGNPTNIPNPDDYWEFARLTFRVYLMLVVCTSVIKINAIFFQAVGKPLFALVTSVVRDIVCFLPLILLLPLSMGINGILVAAPISDAIAFLTAVIFAFIFFKEINKRERKLKEEALV